MMIRGNSCPLRHKIKVDYELKLSCLVPSTAPESTVGRSREPPVHRDMVAKVGSRKTVLIIAAIVVVIVAVSAILLSNGLNKMETTRQIASNMTTVVVAPGSGGIDRARRGQEQGRREGAGQTDLHGECKDDPPQEAPASTTDTTTSPRAASSLAGRKEARLSSEVEGEEKAGLHLTNRREEAQQPSRAGGMEDGSSLGARCLDRRECQDETTDRSPNSLH
jgi:hypothetical protein